MSITKTITCPHCDSVNRVPADKEVSKAACGHCKQSLLSTEPISLDKKRYEVHVANNDIPLVIDFYADWCGPCKTMAPAFATAAESFPLKARFAKIDTEREQQLAGSFGIRSIPTLIMFKNGQEVDRKSGALSEPQLEAWVESHL